MSGFTPAGVDDRGQRLGERAARRQAGAGASQNEDGHRRGRRAPRSSLVAVIGDPSSALESLPRNGRQFADLVATLPGVGLGLHSDSSRSAQQTAAGQRRQRPRTCNTLSTAATTTTTRSAASRSRFRSKRSQEFSLLRTALRRGVRPRQRGAERRHQERHQSDCAAAGSPCCATTPERADVQREALGAEKQPYERYQYGGSLGGPIVQNKAHYFGAYERTQQDTKQVVNTGNTLPGDGVYDVPFRQNLFTGKLTASPNSRHYLAVRYARDHETQPSGVTPNTAYSAWATSTNSYRLAERESQLADRADVGQRVRVPVLART